MTSDDLQASGFKLDRLGDPVWDVPGLLSRVPIVVIFRGVTTLGDEPRHDSGSAHA